MSSRLRGEGVDAGRHHKNQATTTGLLNHSIVITLYQQQPSGLKRLLNTNATTFLIPKHTGGLQSLLFITLNVNFLLQTFFWLQVSVSTKYSVTSLTMSATSWAWTQSSLGPIGWSWLFCPFRHSPSGQLSSCSARHQVRYSNHLNTEHLNTRFIWMPDFLVSCIQMVEPFEYRSGFQMVVHRNGNYAT